MLLVERWRFVFYAGIGLILSPVLLFVARVRKIKMNKPDGAHILIIPIMTRVGDLVCATPVFRALKNSYPNCKITVLAAKNAAGIIKNNPRIDNLVVMNNPPFKGISGRGRLFYFLYKQKFDYALALANNPFGNLATLFSAAPIRIKTVVRPRTFTEIITDWWNNYIFEYKHCTFLQNHYLRLLEPLNIPFAPPTKEVFVSESGEEKARAFFDSEKLTGVRLVVGMTVTAGNRVKEWPLEYFAELADRIIRNYGAKIIFIDSVNNAELVGRVINMMGEKKSAVRATNFSLEELPSLIKRLSAFIAVDTGAIYIAHALGVPLIDIIGPVEPNEQPPRDDKSIQVLPPSSHKPTSFVIKRPGSVEARRSAARAISVDDVYAAFETLAKKIL